MEEVVVNLPGADGARGSRVVNPNHSGANYA